MKYLEHPAGQAAMETAGAFVKAARTWLRLPAASEIGQRLDTHVKDGQGVRLEVSNQVAPGHVVARNPLPIGNRDGQPLYNEWLIEHAVAVKSYGREVIEGLGHEFTAHRRTAVLRAVPLTRELLAALGGKGDTLAISVDWSSEMMQAKIGDYLTDQGYGSVDT